MPHSYGADFSGVGLLGPSTFDSTTDTSANPAPSAIMMRMESQPCIFYPGAPSPRRAMLVKQKHKQLVMLAQSKMTPADADRLVFPSATRAFGHRGVQR